MHHPVLFSEHGSCNRSRYTCLLEGCIRAWPENSIDCSYCFPHMGLDTCFLKCKTLMLNISEWSVHAKIMTIAKKRSTRLETAEYVLEARSPRLCSCILAAYNSLAGRLVHHIPSDMHGYAYKSTQWARLLKQMLCKSRAPLSATGHLYNWAPCLRKLDHHGYKDYLFYPLRSPATPARSLRRGSFWRSMEKLGPSDSLSTRVCTIIEKLCCMQSKSSSGWNVHRVGLVKSMKVCEQHIPQTFVSPYNRRGLGSRKTICW